MKNELSGISNAAKELVNERGERKSKDWKFNDLHYC